MREVKIYFIMATLIAVIGLGSASRLQAHDLGTYDFSSIDGYALGTPPRAETSIETLAAYLAKPARNDLEKARALFVWITENISYDVESFVNGKIKSEDQKAEVVLRDHRAVCAGYAGLFAALGKAMGLEAVSITGFAKGFRFTPGEVKEGENHHWNAVKINGVWNLLDAAWGAGSLEKNFYFKKEFNDFYFLTPPEQLIYSHFPKDPAWQLLDQPVSRVAFFNQRYLRPPFFKNRLEAVSHRNSVIFASREIAVSLRAPDDVAVCSFLVSPGNSAIPCRIERKDDLILITAAIPEPGDYALKIFSSLKGDSVFKLALTYRVIYTHEKASGTAPLVTVNKRPSV